MVKKKIIRYLGVLFGTIAIFWLFLVVSALIPNEWIRENMKQSALSYAETEAFEYSKSGRWNEIVDNYADSIWLNVAWHMGTENALVSSVDTGYYDGEQYGENVGLYLSVTDDTITPNKDYTRYWHGTAGILRILHICTDVIAIKAVGFIAIVCMIMAVVWILIRDQKSKLAIAFLVSLCGVQFWNVRSCIEYQPAFMIAMLMCVLYLLFEKRGDDSLTVLSIVGGVAIAFFDFLTTETMVILLPLILVTAVRGIDSRNPGIGKSIKNLGIQGSVWLVAYGVTFLTKWILASVLIGENKFAVAMGSVSERVHGIAQQGNGLDVSEQIFAAPVANISTMLGAKQRIDMDLLVRAGVVLAILLIVLLAFKYLYQRKTDKETTVLLLLLGSVVLIRYMVLSNHSYLHAFFTYRGLVSLLFSLFAIVAVHCERKCDN